MQPSTSPLVSSTKTSLPTSTVLRDDAAERAERGLANELVANGIALPGCEPWRSYPLLTPERLLRAFATGGLRDAMTWLDFCRAATQPDSAFFECSVAWMVAQNIKHGVSAEIHGGAFAGRRKVAEAEVDPGARALLDLMCVEWKLRVLNSSYPSRNRAAAQWDARFGFERTGMIPLADVWQGEADNLILTARFYDADRKERTR